MSPQRGQQQNHDATAAVLGVAARFQKKVVIASAGEVYQQTDRSRYSENDAIDLQSAGHERAVCKLSKIVDECLARESPAVTIVLRLFPTIGPRMGWGLGNEVGQFVLENMTSVMRGRAIAPDPDLPSHVSVIDVTDLVQWMLLLACNPRAEGHLFNLGSPISVPLEQLAGRICQAVDRRVKILPPAGGMTDRRVARPVITPDISQVVALTNHRPRVKLDETLRWIHASLLAEPRNANRALQADARG